VEIILGLRQNKTHLWDISNPTYDNKNATKALKNESQ